MKIKYLFLSIVMCVAWSCSSDSDEESSTPSSPASSSLVPGNDERPTNWTFNDNRQYELRMTVQVQLGDTLANYQSGQDLMCATINGEVRAVAEPSETGGVVYYPLIIFDNGGDSNVSLSYYCDSLHRIYTINDWARFDTSAAPTGNSGIYRPKFIN